jgi:hypothetical protein
MSGNAGCVCAPEEFRIIVSSNIAFIEIADLGYERATKPAVAAGDSRNRTEVYRK